MYVRRCYSGRLEFAAPRPDHRGIEHARNLSKRYSFNGQRQRGSSKIYKPKLTSCNGIGIVYGGNKTWNRTQNRLKERSNFRVATRRSDVRYSTHDWRLGGRTKQTEHSAGTFEHADEVKLDQVASKRGNVFRVWPMLANRETFFDSTTINLVLDRAYKQQRFA